MKKKIILIISLIIVLWIVYFGIYFYQNIQITNSLEIYNKKPLDDQHALVRCNWNIFEPEFAYIFFDEDISFDKLNKILWTPEDWKNSYTGGTTVKNTDFHTLLQMVKEDCYQFQKTFYQGDDNKLWWTYTKKRVERKKTKKEIEREKLLDEEYERKVRSGEIIEDTRSIDEIMEELKEEYKTKNN